MGGADAVTVRDRGKPLHRGAEQAPERFRLCLAQLRIFCRDVRDRAVVLAELLTDGNGRVSAWPNRGGRGRITISGQRLRQRPCLTSSRCGLDHRPVFVLEFSDLTSSELGDGVRSSALGQESKRTGRQVVVGMLERAPARVSDREHPGWAPASAIAVHPCGPALDQAAFQQLIEVPPDGGRSQAERAAKSGSTHGPVLQYQPGHAGTRALFSTDVFGASSFSTHVFHNISVP